jgi:hypothetical protein
MKFEAKMNFTNYSEDAMEQVIEQSPGKPFFEHTEDGQREIGKIVSARRVGDTTVVIFDVVTFENMDKFAARMQIIIGKKTRELREWEEKDPGAIECPILECEINDAKAIMTIAKSDILNAEKLDGIKTIYKQTTSGSIYNAVRNLFEKEGVSIES